MRPTAYDDPLAASLVADLQQEFVARYGGPDETPVDPAEFAPPRGQFFVAWVDGEPVGLGGWRHAAPDGTATEGDVVGEVKRMYVVAAHRRRGFSRQILAVLEDDARAAGVTRLRLETGIVQPEAIALYEASGYRRIPNFGHYRESPMSLCYGKRISG